MLAAAAFQLFIFAGPAASDIAWNAVFMASIAACVRAWDIACEFSILSFFCESSLLGLLFLSLPK